MPILDSQNRGLTPSVSVEARPVVTTTLFPSGTPTPITVVHSNRKPVPVGAIAGGVIAGAVLAIAVVVAWAWWGKSIKRKQAKQLREAATKSNTLRNAATPARPRTYTYRPMFSRESSEKKVKFVPSPKPILKDTKVQPPPPPSVPPPLRAKTLPPSPNGGKSTPAVLHKPSNPKPLRSVKVSQNLRVHTEANARRPEGVPMKSSPLARFLPHKASSLSSGSVYSTQSGEEHQPRANLLAAALGHLGNTRNPDSAYSSVDGRGSGSGWSIFPRSSNGATINQPSRLSQASSGSMYSQPPDPSGIPIGFAYGGPE